MSERTLPDKRVCHCSTEEPEAAGSGVLLFSCLWQSRSRTQVNHEQKGSRLERTNTHKEKQELATLNASTTR